jgi:hypothetical protein
MNLSAFVCVYVYVCALISSFNDVFNKKNHCYNAFQCSSIYGHIDVKAILYIQQDLNFMCKKCLEVSLARFTAYTELTYACMITCFRHFPLSLSLADSYYNDNDKKRDHKCHTRTE